MSELTAIILKSGILEENTLAEFRRWKLPLPEAEDTTNALLSDVKISPENLAQLLERAMQEEGYVLTRETDLDALPRFLNSMRPGVLHLTTPDVIGAEIRVMVGKQVTGKLTEYIIPWNADTITEWLMNGETYLEVEGKKVFFSSVRELFFGGTKAFLLCADSGYSDDS